MKTGIHPTYYEDAVVTCRGCGYTFKTGSTKKEIFVEVCYKCHPFYTGEQKYIDTKGLVDKFKRRQEAAKKLQEKRKEKKKEKKQQERAKSLKELLQEL